MVRAIFSILSGIAITFGLFVFMAFLISGGAKRNTENAESVVIDIVSSPPESKVGTRRRVPPPPPPPPKQPPKPQQAEPEPQQAVAGAVSFNVPSVDVGGKSLGMEAPSMAAEDGDATPIVRIEPKYPVKAARDGKEGWVQLSFTINEVGGVEDIKVIKAEPKRLFDKEAKKALRKWKYKPKVVDGKAVRQPGMTVELVFKLDKG